MLSHVFSQFVVCGESIVTNGASLSKQAIGFITDLHNSKYFLP